MYSTNPDLAPEHWYLMIKKLMIILMLVVLWQNSNGSHEQENFLEQINQSGTVVVASFTAQLQYKMVHRI
jgi:hypothetical protein